MPEAAGCIANRAKSDSPLEQPRERRSPARAARPLNRSPRRARHRWRPPRRFVQRNRFCEFPCIVPLAATPSFPAKESPWELPGAGPRRALWKRPSRRFPSRLPPWPEEPAWAPPAGLAATVSRANGTCLLLRPSCHGLLHRGLVQPVLPLRSWRGTPHSITRLPRHDSKLT